MARRPRPADRRPRSHRRAVLALVVATLAASTYVAVNRWFRAEAASRLPVAPDVTSRPAALVQHLADADAATRRSPTDSQAVGSLGMAYHADLFYEQAVAAYALAAELDPSNWRWIYYRALVHFERGEAASAGEALRTVVKDQPGFRLAWWRLGEAAFKQARYEEADAAYARAESGASHTDETAISAYALVGRARVALHRNDALGAQRILEGIVSTQPRFGVAHRLLAEALRARGSTEESEWHVIRASLGAYAAPRDPLVDALADMSHSSTFLLRYSASLDLVRDAARREQIVRRALDMDRDNPDVVYEMGSLLQQLRRPVDALPYFSRHLEMVSDDQQTLVQIGKSYSDLAQLDEAERSIRQALAIGDDAVGFYNLGFVLERRHRMEEAEATYRRAIALGPWLASARNNLGALLARRGLLDEGATHLRESIRLDPASPDAYTNLSAVMLQRGAFDQAAALARLAIEADARHADAYVNLGIALARLGDIDQARRQLEEALGLDPRHENARRNLTVLGGSLRSR